MTIYLHTEAMSYTKLALEHADQDAFTEEEDDAHDKAAHAGERTVVNAVLTVCLAVLSILVVNESI